jgi:glutaconate CoA-transferase subunit A
MNDPSFVEARRRLESKDRSMRDKRTSLAEATSLVHDGDHVAIGGCLYSRTPMATLLQLLRAGRRELTLSRNLMCFEGELFLVDGASTHLVTSWTGLGLPWGLSKITRTFVEEGRATYEEWSHLALGLRYRAGAMGIPFLPTLSMLGSDLMSHTNARELDCPFTGERLCLIPASFPDIALIHVHRADRFGNAQIDGYPHMDVDIARASQIVIVSAEEIVGDDEMARQPDRTVIPHFVVDAVVEAPFGSYPHECYGLYDADLEHFDEYVQSIDRDGVDAVRAYLDARVHGTTDHAGFLDTFGPTSLAEARERARALTEP